MTEIPEHLLKRSRERRAAIGQGGDGGDSGDAAESTESSSAPATTGSAPATAAASAPASTGPAPRAAAPTPEAPKPPKPDPAYVVAAKQRRKVPWWAMATLSLMPVWGFMYVRALTEPADTAEGPIGIGAEVYSQCASCHGANGGGGVGYAFAGGEVLETFPNIEDQIRWIVYGTEGYNLEGIEIYGNPDREGGPHLTGGMGNMPAFGDQLEPAEILGVTCHERYTLGGADPSSEEYAEEFEQWCSEESPVFESMEGGEFELEVGEMEPFETAEGEEFEINPIGPVPIPGLPGEQ